MATRFFPVMHTVELTQEHLFASEELGRIDKHAEIWHCSLGMSAKEVLKQLESKQQRSVHEPHPTQR